MYELIFKNIIVEMVIIDGIAYFNPYHVGVCLGLGESAVRMALSKMTHKQVVKLTNSDVKDIDFRKLHNTGENFLTESGIYKLTFRSNKEQAEEFQNWLAEDVLPMIRQTGSYLSPKDQLKLQLFSDDKLVVVNAHKTLIEMEKAPLIAKIEEQAPDVAFAKAIGDSEGLIYISDLAKILRQNGVDIGGNRLFDWLRDNGYLIKRKGQTRNLPTQRSIELGVLKMIESPGIDCHGNPVINKTTMVTPKGQRYFLNKFLALEVKGA